MMKRVSQFLALVFLTAVEAVRQPICLLLTSTCVVMTILVPILMMHKFGEEGKLARDSGLALQLVFGLFIGGHAASTSLAREMRGGTAAAILSKPVGRSLFFLSKFGGVALVVVLFSVCAASATLLSERIAERFIIGEGLAGYFTDWRTARAALLAVVAAYVVAAAVNYVRRRPFTSSAFWMLLLSLGLAVAWCGFYDRTGAWRPFSFVYDWRIVPASALVAMALLVLAAVALSLSARLDTVPTLTVCAAVFLAGMLSDYLLGRHAESSAVAAAAYRLVPNWQHYWMCDTLSAGGRISLAYLGVGAVYTLLCAAGVLLIGAAVFQHADVT
jgi:hypothetical protein